MNEKEGLVSENLGHSPAQESGQKVSDPAANGQAKGPTGIRASGKARAIQGRTANHRELPQKSYFVETDDGAFRVTVPADWLITFGPMYVSNKTKFGDPKAIPTALRFYEGKHQRACLLNVTNFHDLSIKFEKVEPGENYAGTH